MGRHAWPRVRARITLLVLLAALLVAAGVALLLTNTIALRSSAQSTTHADVYLMRVVNVERLVVDSETGLRGQVITGRSLFLQPLHRAQARLPVAIGALERSAARDHAYQPQTRTLIAAVYAYMSRYVPRVVALATYDLPLARSLAVTLRGKRLVDGIRLRSAHLVQQLLDSQAARQRTAHDTADRSIGEAISVLVLLTLLTAALGAYLGHLVVSRERARRRSEDTARTLQESILPSGIPTLPGCELAVRFVPGVGPVSGDFYDVLMVEPKTWAVVIGDVCGKGTTAAAATAMARWTLRGALTRGATSAEALQALNEVTLGSHPEDRFITAACLRLTLEPERVLVDIACAGHPAPVLVPAQGTPSAVAARGDLLGVLEDVRLQTAELELHPGDSLVAYTDGVTDQGPEVRRSPEEALGERSEGADAQELANILHNLALQPVGRHRDDIAILALRFLGLQADPAASSTEAGVAAAS